ncbi:MAG: endonuclease/exonuclease/phosphatase family protein [Planctomycetota bacterium]|jgi:endonuclease/exonuclease/phosphatase family metal-dependent hydrolase
MKLRVMTWNIHKGIGGVDRRYKPERIIELIAHYGPDIVLAQEVDENVKRSAFHRQVDTLGEALAMRHRGYGPNVNVARGRYGNAILSRWPVKDIRNIDLTLKPKKARGALYAKVRVRQGRRSRTVVLFNMHLGLAGFERKIQLRRLIDMFDFHGNTPMILGGDFNDVWGTLGRKILAPAGFRQAGGLVNTFPAYLPTRPLDGIHVRGEVQVERCFRSRLKLARAASDHLPLIADLNIPKRSRG